MAYEFSEYEYEPEPQPSSGRSAIPPRKFTGVGVLDRAVPPKKPLGPIPRIPVSTIVRIIAGTVLLAVLASMIAMLFSH
jgi:hypothetical protein